MSVWKTADEARKICEEYENREKYMEQARRKVAEEIEKSLKSHERCVVITIDEVSVNLDDLKIIRDELIKDGYGAKIKEEEPLTDNHGLAWGKNPARLQIVW